MIKVKYCCDKFAEHAIKKFSENGGFEWDGEGGVAVNGCCGGGCYIFTGMKYCPFCGVEVTEDED